MIAEDIPASQVQAIQPSSYEEEYRKNGQLRREQRRLKRIEREAKMASMPKGPIRHYPLQPEKLAHLFNEISSLAFAESHFKTNLIKIFGKLRKRRHIWWYGPFIFHPTEKFIKPEALIMNVREVLNRLETKQRRLAIVHTQLAHEGYEEERERRSSLKLTERLFGNRNFGNK